MRVVHQDRKRLALLDRLEPARHPTGVGQRSGGGPARHAERLAGPQGGERVLDVEMAGQGGPNRHLPAGAQAPKPGSRGVEGGVEGTKVGPLRSTRREGHETGHGSLPELGRQPGAVGIVHVHGGGPGRREEQPSLGLEVLLHVAVEVEVILGQVGEHGDRESDPGRPVERQRVRADLHRAGPVARLEHAPKGRLEVDRLGGRPLDLLLHPAHHLLDRSQEPGPDPLGLEHVPDQERGGGLSVGAGHTGDPQGRRRVAPEVDRDRRHRRARIGDPDLGGGEVEGSLDHQRGGPVGDRLIGELVAVGVLPPDAEEEVAGLDAAAVVGEPGDLDLSIPGDLGDGDAGEQLAELHCGDSRAPVGRLRPGPVGSPDRGARTWRSRRRRARPRCRRSSCRPAAG